MSDSSITEELMDAARNWAAGDPDADTRAQLERLIEQRDASLAELFSGALEFGTAGLRGIVGPGPMRMNRAVVRRTTAAVADYLLAQGAETLALPVVVGCDARLSSRTFLEDAVGVLVAKGLKVRYLLEPAPTPVIAYAARHVCASAGIMITASHNPPEYNGYKLYAANGAQIIPPIDGEIARRIAEIGPASSIPHVEGAVSGGHELAEPVADAVIEHYYAGVEALRADLPRDYGIGIVYTPMHGVGGKPVLRALGTAGYTNVHPVPQQFEPDGRFPTVQFPNPEEPGALDLAKETAAGVNADLILANDPDADRLAACIRGEAGEWVQLTGNQVGLLLADDILSRAPAKPKPLVAQSIVSSPMLRDIAETYGARFEQTLTGFKWIWNCALAIERKSKTRFVFGYEEALGYSAGDLVRDKDGVSAAVLFADLTAALRRAGSGIRQRLTDLYVKHGLWVSVQRSVTLLGSDGQRRILSAMEKLGASPPRKVGAYPVSEIRDFRQGQEERPLWLPNSNLIEIGLGDAGRVLVRPSGTEPKLKFYVDLRQRVEASQVGAAERQLTETARELAQQVVTELGLS